MTTINRKMNSYPSTLVVVIIMLSICHICASIDADPGTAETPFEDLTTETPTTSIGDVATATLFTTASALNGTSPSYAANTDIRTPPTLIYSLSATTVFFRPFQAVTLQCSASGTPTPTIQWFKNGIIITATATSAKSNATTASSISIVTTSDTFSSTSVLAISQPVQTSTGYYQCWAENNWGIAVSNVSRLQIAIQGFFPAPTVVNYYRAAVGQALKVPCSGAPLSIPAGSLSWVVTNAFDSSAQSPVVLNSRVQMDQNGTLYWANILLRDSNRGKLLACNEFNSYLDSTSTGSYTNIAVSEPMHGAPNSAPTIAFIYSSPSSTILSRQTVELHCFFYGYPTPTVTWSKVNGSLPNQGPRQNKQTNSNIFTITNPVASDAGQYECVGTNIAGVAKQTIELTFGAAPMFMSIMSGPRNINATQGDNVTFNCNPMSVPSSDLTWMINGEILDVSTIGNDDVIMSSDMTKLTVLNVCKTCADGRQDLAVVQCNASNIFGFVFAEGYLNVLLPTVIVMPPTDQAFIPYQAFTFDCQATSDPSTPVTITWKINSKEVSGHHSSILQINSTSLTVNTATLPHGGQDLIGTSYTCVANNGYSSASATAFLLADMSSTASKSSSEMASTTVVPTTTMRNHFNFWSIWWSHVKKSNTIPTIQSSSTISTTNVGTADVSVPTATTGLSGATKRIRPIIIHRRANESSTSNTPNSEGSTMSTSVYQSNSMSTLGDISTTINAGSTSYDVTATPTLGDLSMPTVYSGSPSPAINDASTPSNPITASYSTPVYESVPSNSQNYFTSTPVDSSLPSFSNSMPTYMSTPIDASTPLNSQSTFDATMPAVSSTATNYESTDTTIQGSLASTISNGITKRIHRPIKHRISNETLTSTTLTSEYTEIITPKHSSDDSSDDSSETSTSKSVATRRIHKPVIHRRANESAATTTAAPENNETETPNDNTAMPVSTSSVTRLIHRPIIHRRINESVMTTVAAEYTERQTPIYDGENSTGITGVTRGLHRPIIHRRANESSTSTTQYSENTGTPTPSDNSGTSASLTGVTRHIRRPIIHRRANDSAIATTPSSENTETEPIDDNTEMYTSTNVFTRRIRRPIIHRRVNASEITTAASEYTEVPDENTETSPEITRVTGRMHRPIIHRRANESSTSTTQYSENTETPTPSDNSGTSASLTGVTRHIRRPIIHRRANDSAIATTPSSENTETEPIDDNTEMYTSTNVFTRRIRRPIIHRRVNASEITTAASEYTEVPDENTETSPEITRVTGRMHRPIIHRRANESSTSTTQYSENTETPTPSDNSGTSASPTGVTRHIRRPIIHRRANDSAIATTPSLENTETEPIDDNTEMYTSTNVFTRRIRRPMIHRRVNTSEITTVASEYTEVPDENTEMSPEITRVTGHMHRPIIHRRANESSTSTTQYSENTETPTPSDNSGTSASPTGATRHIWRPIIHRRLTAPESSTTQIYDNSNTPVTPVFGSTPSTSSTVESSTTSSNRHRMGILHRNTNSPPSVSTTTVGTISTLSGSEAQDTTTTAYSAPSSTVLPPSSSVSLPPSLIVSLPATPVYFQLNHMLMLTCSSTGTPSPKIYWTMNNVAVVSNNVSFVSAGVVKSTLIIPSATSANVGYYQCSAVNDWGVAVSNFSFVQLATLGAFPDASVSLYSVILGSSLMIPCAGAPISVPAGSLSWSETTIRSSTPATVVLSNRIQMDQQGNLYFANTRPEDVEKNMACTEYNAFLKATSKGSYSRLHIIGSTSSAFAPKIAFVYQSPNADILIGQTIELHCFFYGFPTPIITWSKVNGSIPVSRSHNGNTVLTINGARPSDSGVYQCTGTNSAGRSIQTIDLTVADAAPVFSSVQLRPHNVNATQGQNVTFRCQALASPNASITWSIDGVIIDADFNPDKVIMSADKTELIVLDVCKDCDGGVTTDLCVLQCNATNEYGFAYAEGYLNVLLPTIIVVPPTNQTLALYQPIIFTCEASSDPSTAVTISWLFDGVPISERRQGHYRLVYIGRNSLYIITGNMPNGGGDLIGRYTCVAYNGYSFATANAYLLASSSQVASGASILPTSPQPFTTTSLSPTQLVSESSEATDSNDSSYYGSDSPATTTPALSPQSWMTPDESATASTSGSSTPSTSATPQPIIDDVSSKLPSLPAISETLSLSVSASLPSPSETPEEPEYTTNEDSSETRASSSGSSAPSSSTTPSGSLTPPTSGSSATPQGINDEVSVESPSAPASYSPPDISGTLQSSVRVSASTIGTAALPEYTESEDSNITDTQPNMATSEIPNGGDVTVPSQQSTMTPVVSAMLSTPATSATPRGIIDDVTFESPSAPGNYSPPAPSTPLLSSTVSPVASATLSTPATSATPRGIIDDVTFESPSAPGNYSPPAPSTPLLSSTVSPVVSATLSTPATSATPRGIIDDVTFESPSAPGNYSPPAPSTPLLSSTVSPVVSATLSTPATSATPWGIIDDVTFESPSAPGNYSPPAPSTPLLSSTVSPVVSATLSTPATSATPRGIIDDVTFESPSAPGNYSPPAPSTPLLSSTVSPVVSATLSTPATSATPRGIIDDVTFESPSAPGNYSPPAPSTPLWSLPSMSVTPAIPQYTENDDSIVTDGNMSVRLSETTASTTRDSNEITRPSAIIDNGNGEQFTDSFISSVESTSLSVSPDASGSSISGRVEELTAASDRIELTSVSAPDAGKSTPIDLPSTSFNSSNIVTPSAPVYTQYTFVPPMVDYDGPNQPAINDPSNSTDANNTGTIDPTEYNTNTTISGATTVFVVVHKPTVMAVVFALAMNLVMS